MWPGVERIPGLIRAGGSMGAAGAPGETVPPAAWRNRRRSSAMSLAVLYRSDARFDERLQADPFQFLGDRVVDLAGRTRLGGGDRLQDVPERITSEWSLSGQQLVEHDAQAEDVGSPINPVTFAPGLLGTHVGGRAGQPPALAEVLILEGEPEVRHAGFARCVDQDVGGLDVPVDQPSGVGVMQGVGDGGDQLRRIPEGRSSLSHPDRQVAAFDELRHDEAESVLRATHVEDRHDVGMVQPGEDPGFNEKRLDILGVGDSFRVRHLDGDRAVEVIVVSKIDPSEPALTEPTDDPVAADLGGIAVRGAARTLEGRLRAGGSRQALLSHPRSHSNPQRAFGAFRFRQALRLIHRLDPRQRSIAFMAAKRGHCLIPSRDGEVGQDDRRLRRDDLRLSSPMASSPGFHCDSRRRLAVVPSRSGRTPAVPPQRSAGNPIGTVGK